MRRTFRSEPIHRFRPPDTAVARIEILGRFGLIERGSYTDLSEGSQRLLAFLALHGRMARRVLVAGTLWPNATSSRAYSSLRATLSRLGQVTRRVLEVKAVELRLADGVSVDYRESQALAHRLLEPASPNIEDLNSRAISALSGDLLPDWYDDWAVIEAEDWRQLRLHALEAMSRALVTVGRLGDATMAASAAVRADPLRESAHAILIRIHLAEHNQSEAVREYRRYENHLSKELGLEPTAELRDLMGSVKRAVTLE